MAAYGKRYSQSRELSDPQRKYGVAEAIDMLKAMKAAKFDETIDVCVRLGVDPKYADQMVRGSVQLPHGTGQSVRVAVIAKGEKVAEAKAAGADIAGGDEIVEKIQGGWLEFDKLVATPDMMGAVGKLGKILGPRGLMPNPKVGTVTFDVEKTVRALRAGKVDYRVDKAGIVHTILGKASFEAGQIRENFGAIIESILKAKPSTAKGTYLRSVTLSRTMGPGIRVDTKELA